MSVVLVRTCAGSTIADLREHYIQPLLKKRPSTVTIHAGTNDASQEWANADNILETLLDLKVEIEKKISGCQVDLSLPTQRAGRPSASRVIQPLNKKIQSLGIYTVNNNSSQISNPCTLHAPYLPWNNVASSMRHLKMLSK